VPVSPKRVQQEPALANQLDQGCQLVGHAERRASDPSLWPAHIGDVATLRPTSSRR
jgi:hypothetical protein